MIYHRTESLSLRERQPQHKLQQSLLGAPKKPQDKLQILTLAKQIYPGKTDLKEAVKTLWLPTVTRGNSLRQAAFQPVKPNWRESRTRKTTELKLFARARELANSDLLMEVIDGGNCNSVERLARCWHSLLLPEVQGLISTSQGTKVGQELRLFCNAATSLL